MAKFSPTVQDLESLDRRFSEIKKRIYKGSLDPKGAYEALQTIVEGKFPVLSDPFARYSHLLLSLDKQLELLVEYKKKYWGNVFSKGELEAVNTDGDHVQSVTDLEILHVEFGSPGKTLESWAKVIEGTQPNYWRWDSLKSGTDYLRLLEGNTRQYKPGIHRVRINLAAHWEPKNGPLVDVQEQAKTNREILAHGEVLSAYGLHTNLLQQMDGTNLPYVDLAGYEAKPSGYDDWRYSPYLYWNAISDEAGLGANSIDSRYQGYAAPVVWES